jgi:hypothetical protein
MWTRRQLAAVLSMSVAVPAFGAASSAMARPTAKGSGFALAPSFDRYWAKHQSESMARLVQLPKGVGLQAGPMGAVDQNGLAIWSRTSWSEGDFRVRFKTRKLDANAGVGSESLFLLFYFGVQGDGTPDHPVNLAEWPGSTVPYTHAYAEHIRGARITFYFQPPSATGETQPLSAAYFKADGSRNSVQPESTVVFPGLRNVLYGWTVHRVGNAVTVTQRGDGAPRSVTFSSEAFGQFASTGNFGLLVSPGRHVQVTNFSVKKG